MKKYKVIAVVLSLLLVFGFTTNYADAASNSVSKTIQQLKKQIKDLTKSNEKKDKQIKDKDKLIKRLNSNNNKLANQVKTLHERQYKSEQKINEKETQLKNQLENNKRENKQNADSYLGLELRNVLLQSAYSYLEDYEGQGVRQINLVVDHTSPYPYNLESMFTDQELKQIVMRNVGNVRYRFIELKTVTIKLPTRNLVMSINESI